MTHNKLPTYSQNTEIYNVIDLLNSAIDFTSDKNIQKAGLIEIARNKLFEIENNLVK